MLWVQELSVSALGLPSKLPNLKVIFEGPQTSSCCLKSWITLEVWRSLLFHLRLTDSNKWLKIGMKNYNFYLFHMRIFFFNSSSIRMQDVVHICLQTLNSYPWLRFLSFNKKVFVLEITWDILENWSVFVYNLTFVYLSFRTCKFIYLLN